jgi:hypothetical protein
MKLKRVQRSTKRPAKTSTHALKKNTFAILKPKFMAKSKRDLIVPDEIVMSEILLIRRMKEMIYQNRGELYGVPTKRLNEQVKRNIKRFPEVMQSFA